MNYKPLNACAQECACLQIWLYCCSTLSQKHIALIVVMKCIENMFLMLDAFELENEKI